MIDVTYKEFKQSYLKNKIHIQATENDSFIFLESGNISTTIGKTSSPELLDYRRNLEKFVNIKSSEPTTINIIKRIAVGSSYKTYGIPSNIESVIFRNVGSVDLTIGINKESRNDYIQLNAGDSLPVIQVSQGLCFEFKTDSEISYIELIMWGKK